MGDFRHSRLLHGFYGRVVGDGLLCERVVKLVKEQRKLS
jgi:hypothetical protein